MTYAPSKHFLRHGKNLKSWCEATATDRYERIEQVEDRTFEIEVGEAVVVLSMSEMQHLRCSLGVMLDTVAHYEKLKLT